MNAALPASDAPDYVTAVLSLYLGLPETPLQASAQDRRRARQLYDRGVSLRVIESALLASLRRLVRPTDLPPLSAIRSLAYFQPVIEELLANPAPDNYLEYLRLKLRHITGRNVTLTEQAPAIGQRFQMAANTYPDTMPIDQLRRPVEGRSQVEPESPENMPMDKLRQQLSGPSAEISRPQCGEKFPTLLPILRNWNDSTKATSARVFLTKTWNP